MLFTLSATISFALWRKKSVDNEERKKKKKRERKERRRPNGGNWWVDAGKQHCHGNNGV